MVPAKTIAIGPALLQLPPESWQQLFYIITTPQPASQTEGEWSCPISGGAYLYTIKIDLRKVVSGGPEDHISITHYGGQRSWLATGRG